MGSSLRRVHQNKMFSQHKSRINTLSLQIMQNQQIIELGDTSHQRAENLRRRNQELLQEISISERQIERKLEEKRRTVEELERISQKIEQKKAEERTRKEQRARE